ncbi:ABC-type multidrug transport system, ATPase component [Alkalibacterium putridalgicola]|uniref:ABC transporter ATP-binding protein n=1 Tax=Alkalibacterium putridalgicola TaxID=426703 RepID=A0A1H7S8Y5_9LACT|nr:ABC transporter ATP-binding protein [Alkalibacterium putridalgicola]GEK89112.1 ABC transporter ATP-binding protein [Alkalibacterium putridalgicola]SEL69082.1 ABC-type multidrug transport system, ATPase component [Alkalibacterium putridalgicola]
MLEVSHLTKSYKKTKAVDDVTFSAGQGEVVVLVGPNGAGKSTTIKSIVGLLRFEGEISIGTYNNKALKAKELLSYVPEIPTLFPLLTVREHIEYMALAYGKAPDEEKLNALLKRFDLDDKVDKLGDELSKGMMQKVSICSAVIVDPEVIILDEPMIGLDPKAIKEIKKLILELKEANKTVMISTHMIEMIEDLWDRVIFMKEGKVIENIVRTEADLEDLEELFFKITGDSDE